MVWMKPEQAEKQSIDDVNKEESENVMDDLESRWIWASPDSLTSHTGDVTAQLQSKTT